MRVIFHYQLSCSLDNFADAFKKAFAKNTLSILYTRCDKRNLWMDFLLFWSHKLHLGSSKFLYFFFLLKKGTRIVQRAILKEILFLCSRKIFIVSVYTVCVYVLIIMPHVNERDSFVWGRVRKKRKIDFWSLQKFDEFLWE